MEGWAHVNTCACVCADCMWVCAHVHRVYRQLGQFLSLCLINGLPLAPLCRELQSVCSCSFALAALCMHEHYIPLTHRHTHISQQVHRNFNNKRTNSNKNPFSNGTACSQLNKSIKIRMKTGCVYLKCLHCLSVFYDCRKFDQHHPKNNIVPLQDKFLTNLNLMEF